MSKYRFNIYNKEINDYEIGTYVNIESINTLNGKYLVKVYIEEIVYCRIAKRNSHKSVMCYDGFFDTEIEATKKFNELVEEWKCKFNK